MAQRKSKGPAKRKAKMGSSSLLDALRTAFDENQGAFSDEAEDEYYEEQGYEEPLVGGSGDKRSRLSAFLSKLKTNLKTSGEALVIYRAVNVDDVAAFIASLRSGKPVPRHEPDCHAVEDGEAIDCRCPSGLGKYWSYVRESAQPYWGGDGTTVVLKALVRPSAVDMVETLQANLFGEGGGGGENEITLVETSEVHVIALSHDDGDEGLDLSLPV